MQVTCFLKVKIYTTDVVLSCQLQDAETAEQYSTAVTVLEELICLAGCASYMNSIDRVKLLLKSLCHFICIGRAGLALDQ